MVDRYRNKFNKGELFFYAIISVFCIYLVCLSALAYHKYLFDGDGLYAFFGAKNFISGNGFYAGEVYQRLLGLHANWVLLLFYVPLVAIAGSPEVLSLMCISIWAISVFVFYQIAKFMLKDLVPAIPYLDVGMGLLYLLHPFALRYAFDFQLCQPDFFLQPAALLILYGFLTGKRIWFFSGSALMMCVKGEYIFWYVFLLAWLLLLFGKNKFKLTDFGAALVLVITAFSVLGISQYLFAIKVGNHSMYFDLIQTISSKLHILFGVRGAFLVMYLLFLFAAPLLPFLYFLSKKSSDLKRVLVVLGASIALILLRFGANVLADGEFPKFDLHLVASQVSHRFCIVCPVFFVALLETLKTVRVTDAAKCVLFARNCLVSAIALCGLLVFSTDVFKMSARVFTNYRPNQVLATKDQLEIIRKALPVGVFSAKETLILPSLKMFQFFSDRMQLNYGAFQENEELHKRIKVEPERFKYIVSDRQISLRDQTLFESLYEPVVRTQDYVLLQRKTGAR